MTAKIKILLIEDDKSICRFIITALEGNGYKVDMATTAREGISLAAV